jgi:tRNA-2-methylthio-N6-dimethylallyladenosine synthase
MKRRYVIQTLGCQMNAHDSERIAGSLDRAGYLPALDGEDPDLIVFNTCAVRENADNRLYGQLSFLAPQKESNPNLQIAIGGCLAQKDQGKILERAPYVDVVFGTHNVGSLPILLERARIEGEAQIEIKEALEHFPSSLPARRHSAWVSISVGCNNTCTFCIVPALRGREKDREAKAILDEVRTLVEQGVTEITLLGQNVNAYGVELGEQGAFARLLRACGEVDGLERVRFMSPHPRDFTDDVIDAMAETANVMPHLHMPLQSGSDRILQAMRRSYRRSRYLGILERVRKAIPEASITTDIIVGFPGESDEDFEATLSLCDEAQFTAAYTFQYSKRPGTPAAEMEGQVPAEVVKERYERLHRHQEAIALGVNQRAIGREFELLVTESESNREGIRRMSGKSEDARLVHFTVPHQDSAEEIVRPGDFVTVEITEAKPFYLIASDVKRIRPSRGGDAFTARKDEAERSGTLLGMPKLSRATLTAALG